VLEGRILELLKHVRREHFVPAEKKGLAFADMEIPLGYGAAMWQPKLEARTVQELHLTRNDRVLEVGTGSGYLTALLSALAGHVTSSKSCRNCALWPGKTWPLTTATTLPLKLAMRRMAGTTARAMMPSC